MCRLLIMAAVSCRLFAQDAACVLQNKQAGPVKIGMTVAQARVALRGAMLKKSEDGEGIMFLSVTRGSNHVMDLYPDNDADSFERAVIELVRVYDPTCATAEGLRVGMLLAEVEKRFGNVLRVELTEVESREYAHFSRLPAWIDIETGGAAGVYAKGRHCSAQYAPAAKVASLWVSKPRSGSRFFLEDAACSVK